jgi:outer membrane protein TolC
MLHYYVSETTEQFIEQLNGLLKQFQRADVRLDAAKAEMQDAQDAYDLAVAALTVALGQPAHDEI